MTDYAKFQGLVGQRMVGLGGLGGLSPRKKGVKRTVLPIPLLAWWDPADLSTQARDPGGGYGYVRAWTDKVGGRSLVAADDAARLIVDNYHAAGPNCPIFQGLNRGLSSAQGHGLPIGGSESWVFAVAMSAFTHGGVFAYGHGAAESANAWSGAGRGLTFNYSGNQVPNAHRSTNVYAQSFYGSDTLVVMAAHCWRDLGAARDIIEIWTDGVQQQTGTADYSQDVTSPLGLHMSAREYGAGCFFLADCIVTGPLTLAERQWLEGYLHWKYALWAKLPGAHPYRNAAPTA